MSTVIPDLSPADLLGRLRGTVVRAAPGYPEVLILGVRDDDGQIWRFMTFYADYSPSDPEFFLGKTVVDADLDRSDRLTMKFSDGSEFCVAPEPEGPDEDLMTWHLLTPDGLAMRFRPRGHWDLGLGTELFGGDRPARP
jgi:hypothetical protein